MVRSGVYPVVPEAWDPGSGEPHTLQKCPRGLRVSLCQGLAKGGGFTQLVGMGGRSLCPTRGEGAKWDPSPRGSRPAC